MFTVYTEKNIFEEIILYPEQIPHWNKIFCYHAEVCVNMKKPDLEKELAQGTPIWEYILANGGREPVPLSQFFEELKEDYSILTCNPRSAFFLNISKDEAKDLSYSSGVLVISNTNLQENILKKTFFKNLSRGESIRVNTETGWKSLLSKKILPSNSLVITDNYLFSNFEYGRSTGIPNLLQIFDSVLPQRLTTPYDILIVTNDQPTHTKPPLSKEMCENIANELRDGLVGLRDYQINFELVFTKTIHKRRMITNYFLVSMDRGFALFENNGQIIRADNEIQIEGIFARIEPEEGDTVFELTTQLLKEIKQICSSTTSFVINFRQGYTRRVVADSLKISNRLLSEV